MLDSRRRRFRYRLVHFVAGPASCLVASGISCESCARDIRIPKLEPVSPGVFKVICNLFLPRVE